MRRRQFERLLPFLSSAYAGALGNLMSSVVTALLGMLGRLRHIRSAREEGFTT